MFVSRNNELAALNKLYAKGTHQMAVVFGRRRVGKTMLISEFVKNKPAIFFAAQEANEYLNLVLFSKKVREFFGLPNSTGDFRNWHDAFSFLAEKAKQRRFILAIDEFPYLASKDRSVTSTLQNVIDHQMKDTGIFIILCGNQISFMEKEVMGAKSPLFGRCTAQFLIDGFDYYDAARMLPSFSNEDKMKYYACVGGTPHYLGQIDASSTFEENIMNLYFEPQSYLFGEPTMLLRQELREPALYNSIITAIATGSSRLNDISMKIGEKPTTTAKYIKTLVDLRILRKEIPFGENPVRTHKSLYQIEDNCFRFWYRFIFLNRGGVETGTGRLIAENMVFPELPTFVGKPAFEDVCRQYVIRKNRENALPFIATSFGTWWGTDSRTHNSAGIDIVADNKPQGNVLLCECKWRREKMGAADVKKLLDKSLFLSGYSSYHFIFFSKSGFTSAARRMARETPNLQLVTLDALYG